MSTTATSMRESSVDELLLQINGLARSIMEEIKSQYLEDKTPWIVGFSGGKDSTAVLQLIFHALAELEANQLQKEVHVLSNDTLVENPSVVKFLDEQLKLIERAGKERLFSHAHHLFEVAKVTPKLEDTFWLNLIGKGYPSPNRWFRWCTERMKINPTNDYILQQVNEHGKAIIVLGTRKAESGNRAASMKQYKVQGVRLRKHTLPNAYVFAPIAEMSNQEVWTYLVNTPNPWGADNQELLDLYRSASEVMECPLVIDTTTPSCGNSRFGCWTCTVVEKDRSMSNMIANGEEWMLPLMDFRDWLSKIRNDDSKRMKRRRTGQKGIGPFTMETRKKILEKLLRLEKQVGMELISEEELSAIQLQWNFDGNFHESVSEIYKSIKGVETMLPESHSTKHKREEYHILAKACETHGVNPDHVKELMQLEKEHLSFLRRHNIFEDMRKKIERFIDETDDGRASDEN